VPGTAGLLAGGFFSARKQAADLETKARAAQSTTANHLHL